MDALAGTVEAGLARAVGVSNYNATDLRRAHAALARRGIPLASNQVHYSLLHRRPERDGVLAACRELGVTLIAYSPLEMGLLTGKYGPGASPPGARGLRAGARRLATSSPSLGALRAIGEAHGQDPGPGGAQLAHRPGHGAHPGGQARHAGPGQRRGPRLAPDGGGVGDARPPEQVVVTVPPRESDHHGRCRLYRLQRRRAAPGPREQRGRPGQPLPPGGPAVTWTGSPPGGVRWRPEPGAGGHPGRRGHRRGLRRPRGRGGGAAPGRAGGGHHLRAATPARTSRSTPWARSTSSKRPAACPGCGPTSTPPPTRSTAGWRTWASSSAAGATPTPPSRNGVSETQPLDFHSPYGCSKGAADQYTIDYARIYDLPTVTLRQSAIYGPRQLGVEDQGWVAWFCIAAALGRPITVYGDGMQVRDVLWVDDLLDAYDLAIESDRGGSRGRCSTSAGAPPTPWPSSRSCATWSSAWGGPSIPASTSGARGTSGSSWRTSARPGGSWDGRPKVAPSEGVDRLLDWVTANRDLFAGLYG